MTDRPRYTDFGFPLANLPLPGEDVTTLDMLNTVQPLLEGTHAMLMALNVAFVKNIVTTQVLPPATKWFLLTFREA